jgi:uncharacterized protein YlxW (UPF0749 family)
MNNTMPFLYPNTFEGTINWGMNNTNIENRINNLEKEVNNLKNRINRLENKSNNYNDNYSNNYQPNSYNMM